MIFPTPLVKLMVFLIFYGISVNIYCQKDTLSEQLEYVELLVNFQEETLIQRNALLKEQRVIVEKKFQNSNTELWKIPLETNKNNNNIHSATAATIARVNSLPGVLYAEPNYDIEILGIPNDPEFYRLWALQNFGQEAGLVGADINIIPAWDVTTGSTTTTVGILDTGIDWSHEDLVDNIWQNLSEDADGDGHVLEWSNGQWVFDPGDLDGIDNDNNGYIDDLVGWDFVNNDNNPFDDHGHGTHVAGIIGAKGNNGIGTTGVAWNVSLIALKIFDATGGGTVSAAKEALEYALEMNVPLSNHSWGTLENSMAFEETVELALSKEHLLIAAVGNEGINNDLFPLYPASYSQENIIAVTATNRQDALTIFSNYGENSVDIGAPGGGIYSTLPGNFYGLRSGTSMAAPFITGTLALALSTCEKTGLELKSDLLTSTNSLPALKNKTQFGRLDATAFLNTVMRPSADFNHIPFDTLHIELSASIPNESADYTWDFGDGNVQNDSFFVSHTYSESGYYTVCLTVEAECGGQEYCKDIYVSTGNVTPDCAPDWTQFVNGDYILSIAEDTKYIWAGSTGGVTRISKTNQTYEFLTSRNSDLPHNRVNVIEVDAEGVKWIGTEQGGLARFDGSGWTIFNTENSGLPHNNVSAIASDEDGNIWIATNGGGLAKFDKQSSWSVYNYDNANLIPNDLSDVEVVSPFQIYVSSFTQGVWDLFSNTGWQTGNSDIPANTVLDIYYENSTNKLWIATNNGLANRSAVGNWQIYTTNNSGLTSNNILSISIDRTTGVKWIGTDTGIHELDGMAWMFNDNASTGGAILSNKVNAILTTSGGVWLGTDRSLSHYDNTAWSSMTNLNSPIPDNRVNDVEEDVNMNVWVATEACLALYKNDNWTMYTPFNSLLPDEFIYTLLADDNYMWVGTANGLLQANINDLSGSGWQVYTGGILSSEILSITKDGADNLWLGTKENGIAVYNGNTWTYYNTANSNLPVNNINKITYDAIQDVIWIATTAGLVKADGNNWEVFDNNSGIPSLEVRDIDVDETGLKWLTFRNTLANFDGLDWTVYNELTSGIPTEINTFTIDENGDKWLGTAEGLSRFTEDNSSLYTINNSGLPDNDVRAVTIDAAGNRWIATSGGLGKLTELSALFRYDKLMACGNNELSFNSLSSGAEQQRWYVNGTLVGQGPELTYTFPEKGNYEVQLTIISDTDCTASFTEKIGIGDEAIDLELEPAVEVCDDFIDIKANVDHMKVYLWYKDGQLLGNEQVYRAKESGTYCLKVTDWCDKQKIDTTEIFINTDCVWPGDTNDDGIVDARDVLPIGRTYNALTDPRTNASMSWEGQAAPPPLLDGAAATYADANGNGLVNNTDVDVITTNYGYLHGDIQPETLPEEALAGLHIEVEEASIFDGTNELEFKIVLAGEGLTLAPSYGIAYSFIHNSNQAEIDFSNTYLAADNSDVITFQQDWLGQQADIAITRTDLVDILDYGETAGVITLQDLPTSATANVNYTYNFRLENIQLLDKFGNDIPVKGYDITVARNENSPMAVVVETSSYTCQEMGTADIQVYGGTAPYTYEWETGAISQNIEGLLPGVYQVTVTDMEGFVQVGEGRIMDQYGLHVETQTIPETGGLANGAASVNVAGTDNFTCEWSNGYALPSIGGLEAGIYTVTVTDQNDCSVAKEVLVAGELYLLPKVLLEGAYDTISGLMNNQLLELGVLPYGSPYQTGEMSSNDIFNAASANDEMVDWLMIELRHKQDTSLISRQSALLQRDGDVLGADGTPLIFRNIVPDDYFIFIRHRNHLSMLSANPVSLSRNLTEYELWYADEYEELPPGIKELGFNSGLYGLKTGNVRDHILDANEDVNANDKIEWSGSNGLFKVYAPSDFNMDGDVNGYDKSMWKKNNGTFNQMPDNE